MRRTSLHCTGRAIFALGLFCLAPLQAQEGWIWKKVESGTQSHLQDIKMSSGKFGIAVGDDSTVLRYDGKKWQPAGGEIQPDNGGVSSPFPGEPEEGGWGRDAQFDAVTLVDSQSFWIGSSSHATDQRGMGLWNGSYWGPRQQGAVNNRTMALWSNGPDAVLAGRGAPGRINRYDGKAWKVVLEGSIGFFRGIHGQPNGAIWACGLVSQGKGDQGTPLNIVRSLDNGLTWQVEPHIQAIPGARDGWNAIYSLGDSLVWAAGSRGKILSWDGTTAKVTESMTGPAGERKDLRGICALSAGQVWAVGDEGAIMFFNGKNWTAVNTGFEILSDLHAITPDHEGGLWIVGDNGLILHGQAGPS